MITSSPIRARPIRRTRRLLAGVAGIVLLVAACGGDDDASSAATDASTAPARSVESTEATAARETTATTEATATTERQAPPYSDDTATSSPATDAPATDAPIATDAAAPTGPGADAEATTELTLSESDLGTILADADGYSLYLFLPDEQGASTCFDECLGVWPALDAPVTAGDGVDETLIGMSTRPDDGSEQATYNGWPLYYFVQDVVPGDTTGQGLNGAWYVIDVSGEVVRAG